MTSHAHARLLPAIAPTDAFLRLARREGLFWLDSSLRRDADGRFSIMGAEPRWVFTAQGGRWWVRHRDGRSETNGRTAQSVPPGETPARELLPLERLDQLLDEQKVAAATGAHDLPFYGGAVGWLSYDLGRQFEQIPAVAVDDLNVPDVHLAWYDAAIVWDHANATTWLVGIDELACTALAEWLAMPATQLDQAATPSGVVSSNLTRGEYVERVASVRAGITRGEYYQLNLVQRFTCAVDASGPRTYLRLRERNPAPFAAFLSTGSCDVVSSSPERFLEVTPEGRIRTCPIKGTRPRGTSVAEDERLRTELTDSPKEKAELLMIVDLLRNDLGRVCVPGSVSVERLHSVESFATVHHLVGEVQGQLRTDLTRRELLRAVFPGGSITGAPKVSAMHAIEQLEPHRRGIAMGSLGYFSAHGRIDLNIAIRTIVLIAGQAYVSVGAGIVWDSDPASEYAETLVKARALFDALGVVPPSP